jgi:hypothetical protein
LHIDILPLRPQYIDEVDPTMHKSKKERKKTGILIRAAISFPMGVELCGMRLAS